MKKIIVSCAPSGTGSGSNLGMNTVDYAMHNIVKELNLESKVVLAKPWNAYFKDEKGNYPQGYKYDVFPTKFEYNHLQLGGDVEKSLVLYWGDFQQGFDYVTQSANRLHQLSDKISGKKIAKEECLQIAKDYFLLNNYYNEKLPFALGFYGCTLFQNNISNYLSENYGDKLKWLYNQAEYMRLREPYSATMLSQICENYDKNFLGVDAALLTTRKELLNLEQLNPSAFNAFDGSIGFFLGRSSKNFPRFAFYSFLNKLSKKLNSSVVKIPWANFGGNLFVDKQEYFAKILLKKYVSTKPKEFMAGDILESMSRLSLVVTDTYHVAINSIALGIPVICIYEPITNQARNANMGYMESWRDKRVLFFTGHNLSDFLMPVQGLQSSSYQDKKIDHIISILHNKEWKKYSYDYIHKLAAQNRNEIKSLLLKYASN